MRVSRMRGRRRRRLPAVAMLVGLAGVPVLGSGTPGPAAAAWAAGSAESGVIAASAASATTATASAAGETAETGETGEVGETGETMLLAVEVSSTVRASARWLWPLAPPSLSRGFEAPPTPYAAGHRGIDLRAVPGSAVAAPSSATVRFAGVVVDRRVLTLDHGGGVLSSYEPLVSGLSVGDTVTTGDALGRVDTGGHCTDACLHIGVRVDGEYVSPLLFFDRVPRAVLLPLGDVS